MAHTPVTPLRVGFNAALLSPSSDYRAAGMHRYVAALLEAMAGVDGVALSAFVPRVAGDLHATYGLPATIDLRPAPAWVRNPLGRILWEQALLPAQLGRAGVDLLHGPAHAMPAAVKTPAVVTVHDLSFVRMPETFPTAKAVYLQQALRHAAKRATALLTVSEFTKRELIALLGVADERVHVVHNGVDPGCRPLPADGVELWRRRAGLPERFVLAVGTLQPRKNLEMLLEAYARLRASLDAAPALVIAGAAGWGDSDLGRRAAELGLSESIHFPGYVADEDLPKLYNAAEIFALPSRYEGFGLPLVEAMACGTPCVASMASSLPEVAGGAAKLAAPDDPVAWAMALQALLETPELAAAQRESGLERARHFSWTRAASETVEIYRHVLSGDVSRSPETLAESDTPHGRRSLVEASDGSA